MARRDQPIIFPHCDARILHAPEDNCEVCNEQPQWQELRRVWGINFTGHHDPSKTTCPAERERPLDTINRWHGNVPLTPEVKAEMDKSMEQLANLAKPRDQCR